MLDASAVLALISGDDWNNDRVIFIPNMLTRLDDYTRRVRILSEVHPPQNKKKNKNIDIEEEQEQDAIRTRLKLKFDSLWSRYPVKDGRKEAERHYFATVKTEADIERIELSLAHYLNHLIVSQYQAKNGNTWFNNWTDWEHWQEPEGAHYGRNGSERESYAERVIRKNREAAERVNQLIFGTAGNGNGTASPGGPNPHVLPRPKRSE